LCGQVGLILQQLWDINLNGLRFGLAEQSLRRGLLQEFVTEGAELDLATAKPSQLLDRGLPLTKPLTFWYR
jgi:hypothetical protein